MKEIIFDTDIGMDCDDAVALAILLNAQKQNKCNIRAITVASAREGGSATVKAICDYYGVTGIPVAKLTKTFLKCDYVNNYARSVKEKYKTNDTTADAVDLLRKTLAQTKEKITFIAVGPLTNLKDLLLSEGDEFSSLDGISLVKEKVESLYVMGGLFEQNYTSEAFAERCILREWNILQDVAAAQTVAEKWPTEILYLPHEVGAGIFTDMMKGENPVWYSMLEFARNEKKAMPDGCFKRESWDPVTCMIALNPEDKKYAYSPYGKITVSEKGDTLFSETENGKDRFVSVCSDYKAIEQELNTLIERK